MNQHDREALEEIGEPRIRQVLSSIKNLQRDLMLLDHKTGAMIDKERNDRGHNDVIAKELRAAQLKIGAAESKLSTFAFELKKRLERQ